MRKQTLGVEGIGEHVVAQASRVVGLDDLAEVAAFLDRATRRCLHDRDRRRRATCPTP